MEGGRVRRAYVFLGMSCRPKSVPNAESFILDLGPPSSKSIFHFRLGTTNDVLCLSMLIHDYIYIYIQVVPGQAGGGSFL